jgi:hypothetical protein
MFRQRGDDLTVAVLEAGSVAFATVLVTLEIRHFATSGQPFAPGTSFLEAALQVTSLAVLASATMRIATRLRRPVLQWGWRIQGALAIAGGTLLLMANPAVTGDPVGQWVLLDWLLPAYALPAMLGLVALRHQATAKPNDRCWRVTHWWRVSRGSRWRSATCSTAVPLIWTRCRWWTPNSGRGPPPGWHTVRC